MTRYLRFPINFLETRLTYVATFRPSLKLVKSLFEKALASPCEGTERRPTGIRSPSRLPARYVMGRDGTILYVELNPDYTRRPEPEDMLPVLRQAAVRRAAWRPSSGASPYAWC